MGTGHHHLSKIYINTLSCVKSTPLRDINSLLQGQEQTFLKWYLVVLHIQLATVPSQKSYSI